MRLLESLLQQRPHAGDHRSKGARRVIRGLGLCGLAVLLGGSDFEVELKCEEAVKHLADCCVGLRPGTFNCQRDCSVPRFTVDGAECLLSLSCEQLVARGLCDIPDPANESFGDAGQPQCR